MTFCKYHVISILLFPIWLCLFSFVFFKFRNCRHSGRRSCSCFLVPLLCIQYTQKCFGNVCVCYAFTFTNLYTKQWEWECGTDQQIHHTIWKSIVLKSRVAHVLTTITIKMLLAVICSPSLSVVLFTLLLLLLIISLRIDFGTYDDDRTTRFVHIRLCLRMNWTHTHTHIVCTSHTFFCKFWQSFRACTKSVH